MHVTQMVHPVYLSLEGWFRSEYYVFFFFFFAAADQLSPVYYNSWNGQSFFLQKTKKNFNIDFVGKYLVCPHAEFIWGSLLWCS